MRKSFLLAVLGVLLSFGASHGALIGSVPKEVLSAGTEDMAAAAERPEGDEKLRYTHRSPLQPAHKDGHLSQPQDMAGENKRKNGRKKGKGLKRDPCQRKYKDFCIHGECRYLKRVKEPSCVCHSGYHGERCHALILHLGNPSDGYDHTTVLAVVAVVLSSFCLIVISSLLILRYHKRGAYNVENEEKLKFGSPT